jgi:transcription-repair coupling factor (superfamily II helicase)
VTDADLDPLPSLVPPVGVEAAKLADVASRITGASRGRVDVAGVRGCASAMVASAVARTGRKVVVVTSDAEGARRLAEDIAILRGPDDADDAVIAFIADETSPYAPVNPDRRAAMSRMACLSTLASRGLGGRVVVMAATSLARRVVPPDVVRAYTQRIVAEDALDREWLVARLGETGYIRVPLVEDPGSFAVRGALLDVWPPNLPSPVRVELYGDLVISIKPFDSQDQKTRSDASAPLTEVLIAPAREAILAQKYVARARDRIGQLADAMDMPTLKARALIEDVASGRAFFGADAYVPAFYDELSSLFAYLGEDAVVMLDDPPAIAASLREVRSRAEQDLLHEHTPQFLVSTFFDSEEDVMAQLARRRTVALHRFLSAATQAAEGGASKQPSLDEYEMPATEPITAYALDHEDLGRAVKMSRATRRASGASLAPLVRRIAHWHDHGLRVVVSARAETQAERIASLLGHLGVRVAPHERASENVLDPGVRSRERGVVDLVASKLSRGVVLVADGLVIVTEEEIFGARAHLRGARSSDKRGESAAAARSFSEDLRSLVVGDYVVHVDHGIGRYQGLVHKDVGGLTVDLLVIEYDAGDKLYLPVYRLNQLQKYSGREGAPPKIDRLGGQTFARTKSRAKKAIRQMADELLRLYADRRAQTRPPLPALDDEYRAFEATFPFDETPDQAKAIDDVHDDLSEPRPMDRLVCGDVGFGKTEVAIRAAFRVAMAGRQVAVLCPTTVLAQQHFRTFEARLRDYPIRIAALSRFQSDKEHRETLLALKESKVEIVIGTHRLLSKDVHFKDLGLLVVDEEQRFGVAHKERIKQLRAHVDVLTLTATPIPRTLQMAVGGLRDLSLIKTAPTDRRAVRTVVTRFDESILSEAVRRELARGGQTFYVYNRIEGIYERAQRLQAMVPEARIAVGHGQMSVPRARKGGGEGEPNEGEEKMQSALEKTMIDFVDGKYDVLVATAIVESGLDIPRANTILIDRADMFGLSQLYQLRGRVGRSKERAYCYLIVPPIDAMTDEARARIEAIERHTELGSGFQIASLDLELRGAGDVLGGEQSGTMATVGFDLFCQMLEEAVHELRGEEIVHEVDPELSFDVVALLPETYVPDVGVRLSLYKRLASAIDEAHVAAIAEEMEDRFGPPPSEAKRLAQLMSLKTELRRMRVLGCEANARQVTLHLREDTPLDPKKISELIAARKSAYRLSPDMRLVRRFDGTRGAIENVEAILIDLSKCLKV